MNKPNNWTGTQEQWDALRNNMIKHLGGQVVTAYRRAAQWLNAVQAFIDSLPRKVVDGVEYPDHQRHAEATVPYPSLRRMPGKDSTRRGYWNAADLRERFGVDLGECPADLRGTLAEMRWTCFRLRDLHPDLIRFRSLPPLPRCVAERQPV